VKKEAYVAVAAEGGGDGVLSSDDMQGILSLDKAPTKSKSRNALIQII